jgi:nucleotide-binding universal stress UspA family protein
MRVLVATDGSERAQAAIELVASIDWPTGSTIHVVEAVSSGLAVFGGPWPPVPPVDTTAFDDAIRAEAERHLDAASERLAGDGRSIQTSVTSGRAADVITSIAGDWGAELIVVGSRGHGTLESMLLGSVSAEVVDRARVPVLVARREAIGRVVFAWDGSDGAEKAAALLVDWGIFGRSEVRVVSVADAAAPWWVESGMVGEEVAAEAYARAAEPSRQQHVQMAQEMADRLAASGLHVVPECRSGDPAQQIVNAAEEATADLVVLGTHGRTGLSRLLMGSVTRNVLNHARCSVLVVHAAELDEQAKDAD